MLVCNALSDLYADDFTYHFSFATGERLRSFFDLFPSMYAHYKTMNGRIVAHFFTQLFCLLPTPLFHVLNAGMFVLQVWLLYRIAVPRGQTNCLLALGIFSMIWVYQPDFGQVNLWLDGACNYLWCAVFVLLALMPFVRKYLYGDEVTGVVRQVAWMLFGFLAGCYGENASSVGIFIMLVLMLLIRFYKKEKVSYYFIGICCTNLIGFAVMALSPAEISKKVGSMGWGAYRTNFMNALDMYKRFWILALIFVVLSVFAVIQKLSTKRLLLSALLFVGSLCSNFMLVFARYYAARNAFFPVITLVAADAVLLQMVYESPKKATAASGLAVLTLVASYWCCVGLNDIYEVHAAYQKNEQYLLSEKAAGRLHVTLPLLYPKTAYPAGKGLEYLNCRENDVWPNTGMADYYELNTVSGVY